MQQMMNRRMISGLSVALGLCLALLAQSPVMADEVTTLRLSQSIEQLEVKSSEELTEMLDQAPLRVEPELLVSGSREVSVAAKVLTAEHLADQVFHIFDAQTMLSGDDDADGFFYQLRVTFDADVDHGEAFVYASLYLSFEGGPWNHYFTTDVFEILEDSSVDDYVVETRLLEGYPTGYYDVLIELYDADWDTHVASYGPDDEEMLFALPLEDLQMDYPGADYYTYPVDDCHDCGGGGSFGLISLVLLVLWFRISQVLPTLLPTIAANRLLIRCTHKYNFDGVLGSSEDFSAARASHPPAGSFSAADPPLVGLFSQAPFTEIQCYRCG